MTEDLRPPFRQQFDNARDPYTARNALGIVGTGAGLITSASAPLSITGGVLAIDLVVPPQGRLTLQTATPVMTSTQSAKTTIYYSPYVGNKVPIYDGTKITMTTFAELSVATTDTTKSPAAIGASKVNDWFVWNDAGTIRIGHGPDWTSDTVRSAGTALVMVNGILLNNAAITNGPAASRGTYVGTTRSNASSQLDWIYGDSAVGGSPAFLGVWNCYNRVNVSTIVTEATASWAYGFTTNRPSFNSTGNRISFVLGLAEDSVMASFGQTIYGGSGYGASGIALDSITATDKWTLSGTSDAGASLAPNLAIVPYNGVLGFHFIQAMEFSAYGTTTYYGGNGFMFSAQLRM